MSEPGSSKPQSKSDDVLEVNREAWDALVAEGQRHTKPVTPEALADPLKTLDPVGWFGPVAGKRVLCLAAGGGYQSALFAAAGASVTVLDISPAMLELDQQVAEKHGFDIKIVQGSMTDLWSLPASSFDLVAQPVSTCYVEDILRVYCEVARVTRPGGLYVSQHKQPASLQGDVQWDGKGYRLTEPYYRKGPLPPSKPSRHREAGTLEFLHRWHEMLGGLCRAGFVIEDLREPYHGGKTTPEPGSWAHRCVFMPPYVRIKARRHGGPPADSLWLPS
jgi:SAM-dependent methyltransferase